MALIVRDGEYEEFKLALDEFPEIKKIFLELKDQYDTLIADVERVYETHKNEPDQKAFAQKVAKYKFSSVLFSMRKTGQTPKAILSKMLEKQYLTLLGVKWETLSKH